jgi:hypothetical protein
MTSHLDPFDGKFPSQPSEPPPAPRFNVPRARQRQERDPVIVGMIVLAVGGLVLTAACLLIIREPSKSRFTPSPSRPVAPNAPATTGKSRFAPIAGINGDVSMERMLEHLQRSLAIEDTLVTPSQGFEQWGKVFFEGWETRTRDKLNSPDNIFGGLELLGGGSGVVLVIRYEGNARDFAEPVLVRSGSQHAYGNFLFQGEAAEVQQIRRVLGD